MTGGIQSTETGFEFFLRSKDAPVASRMRANQAKGLVFGLSINYLTLRSKQVNYLLSLLSVSPGQGEKAVQRVPINLASFSLKASKEGR
jgi:hypothetical protein